MENREDFIDAVKDVDELYIAVPPGAALGEEQLGRTPASFVRNTSPDGKYYRILPEPYNVALDGPSGSGKSTIAKKAAEILSINYLDTGAMYRALTYFLMEKKINLHEEEAIKEVLPEANLDYDGGALFLNGRPLGKEIRTKEVTDRVSLVSGYGFVREKMTAIQREIAKKSSVILDGRDIGTVVLPDADVKIYLTADVKVRARRRYGQMEGEVPYEMVLSDLIRRDEYDSTREIAPLKKAEDAVVLDNSDLGEEETVEKVLAFVYGGVD